MAGWWARQVGSRAYNVLAFMEAAGARRSGDDMEILGEAAASFAIAAEQAPPGPRRNRYLVRSATLRIARFRRTGNASDLATGIQALERVLSADPPDTEQYAEATAELASALRRTGSRADFDRSIELLRREVPAGVDVTGRTRVTRALGAGLLHRFRRDGDPGDLDAAIEAARAAADDDALLADALLERDARRGDPAAVDEAVGLLRRATADQTEQGWALRCGELAQALVRQYRIRREPALLDEAVDVARRAGAEADPGFDRLAAQHDLGVVLFARYEARGDPADLSAAVAALRSAVAGLPTGAPGRPDRLAWLATALTVRATHLGARADLDEAIALLREAGPAHRGALVNALIARADVDGAVEIGRHLVGGDTSDRSAAGLAYLTRHLSSGDLGDLERAIEVLRAAMRDANPAELERRLVLFDHLGTALAARYAATGAPADLDEAVDLLRSAAERLAPGDAIRGAVLSRLSVALRYRYGLHGARSDIDEAVEVLREASDGAGRTMHLTALANALQTRHDLTDDPEDLRGAADAARAALRDAGPDDPMYASLLNNVGIVLHRTFEVTGDRDDLDEAEYALRTSLDSGGRDDADWWMVPLNLAQVQFARYELDGDEDARRDALAHVTALLAAVAPGTPAHASLQIVAGSLYRADPRSATEAVAAFRSAAMNEHAAAVERIRAAIDAARLALRHRAAGVATDMYAVAVSLLPAVAWRGLDRTDQELRLAWLADVATDAAEAGITAGRADAAVECLEQGRTVLWGQLLEQRAELTRLRDAAPALADRLEAALAQPPP
ncbi:hypothetical protein [Dactylosporangium sp. CA-139066]|uniref:hypothetical protein n=1 Tax=Dactylosporangium sp. CA-139066 TaxID=3239930 RepID=UPI003D91A23F